MQLRGGTITAGWVAAATAMTVVTATTIVGNAVMLLAVRRAQRAPAHYALTSLITADLLVGLCVLPLAAMRELFVFHLPWALCAFWSTMDVFCCTASILSLSALGWERWSGITDPLARSRRGRQVRTLVAALWPASAVIATPTALIPSQRHYLPDEMPKACTVNTNIGYVFSSVSFSFYMPTSVMVFFYTMILRALATSPPIRKHKGPISKEPKENETKVTSKCENQKPDEMTKETLDQLKENNNENLTVTHLTPKRTHLRIPKVVIPSPLRASSPLTSLKTLSGIIPRQRRATQTIVMLMSLFLICWTPFFVMLPVDSLCTCVRDTFWLWCTWLGYANSALNPLVYAAASPSVRRALPTSLTNSKSAENVQLSPNVRRPQ